MGGRVSARQEELLNAAARLLSSHGYHGMSMRDLARASGMSLANLYNYFGSKEDLVFALQTRAFDTLIASAEQALDAVEGAEARLYTFIFNHVRFVTTNRDVTRVLVEEAGELPAKRRRSVRELKERYFEIARPLVVAIHKEGCGMPSAVPAGAQSPNEVARSTYNIFGMLNWVYAWYDPSTHGTPQEVARSIHRLALCGLVAQCPSNAVLAKAERHVGQFPVLSPVTALEEI
jgi:AcrR family transcriptional regulator